MTFALLSEVALESPIDPPLAGVRPKWMAAKKYHCDSGLRDIGGYARELPMLVHDESGFFCILHFFWWAHPRQVTCGIER